MSSTRAILSLRYTPVSAQGGVKAAVGSFLRYIHYRDKHVDRAPEEVDRMLRYVAHRDRSSARGRLFSKDRVVGDAERKALGAYVVRSTAGLKPACRKDGRDLTRAVYRMVLSPEDASGLDLRQVARAAMARLEEMAGELPPWIAAEHRNTAHPHVHIVLAARRKTPQGYRGLLITKTRLAGMKEAMHLEIARQRGLELGLPMGQEPILTVRRPAATLVMPKPLATSRSTGRAARLPLLGFLPRHSGFGIRLQAAMRRYQAQMERDYEQHMRERGLER